MAQLLTITKTAKLYGLTRGGVWLAIRENRLPAQEVKTVTDQKVYLINPDDAERLWGHRPQQARAYVESLNNA